MTPTEISQLAQEHASKVCGEGSKGESDWMSAADDYCAGFRAAMGIWYEDAKNWSNYQEECKSLTNKLQKAADLPATGEMMDGDY